VQVSHPAGHQPRGRDRGPVGEDRERKLAPRAQSDLVDLQLPGYQEQHPLGMLLGTDGQHFPLFEPDEAGAPHEVVELLFGERREEAHPRNATPYLLHRQVGTHGTVGSHR
jgi:hypothetical protein